MRYAVALVFSILLLMMPVSTGLACQPPTGPATLSLDGATALVYGQITTEYTSGRVILAVKAYVGPGRLPEQLRMQMLFPGAICAALDPASVLGREYLVVLTDSPPDFSAAALEQAQKFEVYVGAVGTTGLDDVLRMFAADHAYPMQSRTTPAPDRAPVSDEPSGPAAGEPGLPPGRAPRGLWFLAGAGALVLAVATDAYLGRRRRISWAKGAGGAPDRHRVGI